MPQICKAIAAADLFELWQIGDQVYRVKNPEEKDACGIPSDRRWECSLAHWDRFRAVFSFARTLDAETTAQS
jgi:hypothetical protein